MDEEKPAGEMCEVTHGGFGAYVMWSDLNKCLRF